jgi:hypothetical protein
MFFPFNLKQHLQAEALIILTEDTECWFNDRFKDYAGKLKKGSFVIIVYMKSYTAPIKVLCADGIRYI